MSCDGEIRKQDYWTFQGITYWYCFALFLWFVRHIVSDHVIFTSIDNCNYIYYKMLLLQFSREGTYSPPVLVYLYNGEHQTASKYNHILPASVCSRWEEKSVTFRRRKKKAAKLSPLQLLCHLWLKPTDWYKSTGERYIYTPTHTRTSHTLIFQGGL